MELFIKFVSKIVSLIRGVCCPETRRLAAAAMVDGAPSALAIRVQVTFSVAYQDECQPQAQTQHMTNGN